MSKLSEELAFEDGFIDGELTDEDYGFILGPNGELKSVFLPENMPFKQPKNVQKILRIFKIMDGEQLGNSTLH